MTNICHLKHQAAQLLKHYIAFKGGRKFTKLNNSLNTFQTNNMLKKSFSINHNKNWSKKLHNLYLKYQSIKNLNYRLKKSKIR